MAEVYEVKITHQAKLQMADIVDYISHELCAPEAAYNLINKMESQILSLAKSPERYRLIDEEPWRSEGIRKVIVNHFFVYYWIDKKYKIVQVIAVIYEKRNQLQQLRNIKADD